MAQTQDTLVRAIYLDAKDLGNGYYAIPPATMCDDRWHVADEKNVREVVTKPYPIESEGEGPKYSTRMPSWWTPAQQFAVVQDDETPCAFASLSAARYAAYQSKAFVARVVTVDFTTGEEIPA